MSEIRKQLTMKAASEIFKLAAKLNIKPKDIIGMGGDIVKMGKSLFTEKVNPKLTEYISKKGDVPPKILEEIKIHIRSLKNASDNQIELFKLNLKDIVNAKSPVSSVKQPATSDNGLAIIHNLARKLETKNQGKIPSRMDSESQAGTIAAQIQDVTGKSASELNKFIKSEAQLLKILNDWDYGAAMTKQSFNKVPEKVSEKVIDFKGWKPTVIKGGKDTKFNDGGIAKLNSELNQLPEYYLPMANGGRAKFGEGSGIKLYPRANIIQGGETVGENEDIDVKVRDVDYGITGLYEGNNWFAGAEIDKGNVKVDVTQEGETLFKDSMGKEEVVNFIAGFGDPNDEKFQIKVDDEFENVSIVLNKSFATGGIANHFRER